MPADVRRMRIVLLVASACWLAAINLLADLCYAQGRDPFAAPAALIDEVKGEPPADARASKPAAVFVITPATPLAKRQPLAGIADKPGAASLESLENSLNAIVRVEFEEEPLKSAIQRISDIVAVPMVLSVKKLEEASVSPDTPVTKSLQNMTLRSVLRNILKDLELTYVVRDELIQITTPEDAESQLIIRLYRCRDLIDWAAGRGLTAAGAQPKDPALSSLDDKRAIALKEILISSIKPDSWQDVGGPGSIDNFYGLFVISQTSDVHEQIDKLLQVLREAAAVDQPRGRKAIQERRKRGAGATGGAGGAGAGAARGVGGAGGGGGHF